MITNSYIKDGNPMITVENVYKKSKCTLKACIITFSWRVIEALLEENLIELISNDDLRSISTNYPVYRFINTDIGIFKTTVGAPITATLMEEASYIYSCNKFIQFGSCGGLDKNISETMLIVPTHAYRDEGFSYHYMEPSDYIEISNSKTVARILDDLSITYVLGKTWTTDAFYRETKQEVEQRKKEGCIAVEMEVSACQAIANYKNISFYCFLYRCDNLSSPTWEKGIRDRNLSKNKRLEILNVALELAKKVI